MPLGTRAGGAIPGPTLEPLQTAAGGAAVGDVAAAGAPRAEAAISVTMRRPFTLKELLAWPKVTSRFQNRRRSAFSSETPEPLDQL
jgi:hypothetical protein